MRYQLILIYFLSFLFLFSGCSQTDNSKGIKQMITQYTEKVFQMEKSLDLNLVIDSGYVEIYNWKRKEVKFEITKKIRGVQNKETLIKELEDFQIKYRLEDNLLSYNSKYKGNIKNESDKSIELKIFIPKKILNIFCKMGSGKIKIFDRINCSLNMAMDRVDTEINMFEGKLNFKGDQGDFLINNCELLPDSNIKVNKGNINIKAALLNSGNFNFETGTGNLLLSFPGQSKISFEDTGTMDTNEFTSEDSSTKVRLSTGMGKVIVKKY